MNKIIAVGHQKNVGKDTFVGFCYDIIRPEVPKLRIVRHGFADKLYEFCESVYGWAGFKDRVYYQEVPSRKNQMLKIGMTVRDLLIKLGQHIRQFDDQIWLNAVLQSQDFNILFIGDFRFPKEATAIKERGGFCVKIERPGLPEPTDEADCALNGYAGWDLIIRNDGDRHSLHALAETFCKKYIFDGDLCK